MPPFIRSDKPTPISSNPSESGLPFAALDDIGPTVISSPCLQSPRVSTMITSPGRVGVCLKLLHHRFLWLLIGAYVLAAFVPRLGLAVRDVTLGEFTFRDQVSNISLPLLMLAVLLFRSAERRV